MNLNIKIRGNDKKEIFKLLMILTAINILITIVVFMFANVQILKTIILYIMSVVYVGLAIYIIKKENEEVTTTAKESFENKYDPILTRFFIKNEFTLDNELLNAEIYYLIKKGYVYVDKEKNMLKLKDRNQFKQMDALEKIDSNKIREYSSDEIPSYESMFIGKMLFAFHDEIELNEFRRNQKENYYLQRGEICKLTMEKMILYEIEKRQMMGTTNNFNFISIAGILNIITSIILFMVMGRFNIILLLATIINIALNAIIIKNENILSYKYSEEITKYIDDLLEYVEILRKKNNDSKPISIVNQSNSEENELDTELKENQDELSEENEDNSDIVKQEDNLYSDEELALLFGIQKLEF